MKIYLAGPDVFRQNPLAWGKYLKGICEKYKAQGLWPMDNEVDLSPENNPALVIYKANIAMIDECDAVVANISPFRGPNMDPGTAFEIGYATAKHKKVYAYADNFSSLKKRTESCQPTADAKMFPNIEDFGLIENLMICALRGPYYSVEGAIAAAVWRYHDDYAKRKNPNTLSTL